MQEMKRLDRMCPRARRELVEGFAPVLWALTWAAGNKAKQLVMRGRFVSGHRFSDAESASKSTAPLGARLSALIVIALFSICALADSGADIYKAHCSACHATSGAGDTMLGKNLKLRSLSSSEVQQQSDAELFSITSRGKNRMPAYGRKLSQQQIEAVVKHIRSLKK